MPYGTMSALSPPMTSLGSATFFARTAASPVSA